MIEFYKFGEETPSLTYEHGHCTIGQFIDGLGVDRSAHMAQPVIIFVNGEQVSSFDWDKTFIKPSDRVEAHEFMARGGVFKGLSNIISGVLNFVFGWLMPSQKGGGQRQNQAQGERIEGSGVKANTPKLGETVPEWFGRCRIYPDYVTMPRRYYRDRRTQMLEFAAVVGVGNYDFDVSEVRIADTPISTVPGAVINKYFPGQSLAADPVHLAWYTAPEVGGTSSGTAGLELSTELGNRTNIDPAQYSFAGKTIARGDGEFPVGWGIGAVVSIYMPMSYTITLEELPLPEFGSINRISGSFKHCLPFDIMPLQPIKMNGVDYYVHNASVDAEGDGWIELYDLGTPGTESTPAIPPAPVNDLPLGVGSYDFSVGSGYRVDAISETEITVSRLDASESASPGWLGFPTGSRPAAIAFWRGVVYGEWSGPFNASPIGQVTGLIEYDVLLANGLCQLDEETGESQSYSIGIEVQYRDAAGGAWQSVRHTYTDATMDQIGFTEQVYVGNISPVVRMRRIGAKAISNSIFDNIVWFGLKCRIPTREVYPEWMTITASFVSGGKIATQSENRLNMFATRMLSSLQADNSWSASLLPTRDISAACRYIWHSIGYTDADADMPEFIRLHHQYWQPRGETFDYGMGRVTVKEAIDTALAAGMATMTVEDGRIRPVRDGLRSPGLEERKFSFSDQSVIGDISEEFKPWLPDDYDGVQAEYTDPVTFEPMVTPVYILPGKPGAKIEKITVRGVTDRTRAWRIAARRALAYLYRNQRANFKTEMSGLNLKYWSSLAVIVTDPVVSQSALILKVEQRQDGVYITSSERLQQAPGNTYVAAYRALNGEFKGPYPVVRIIGGKTLVLPVGTPLPKVKNGAELPHLYFGVAQEIERTFLAESIARDGLFNAQVKSVIYDSRVFLEDDNQPPAGDF